MIVPTPELDRRRRDVKSRLDQNDLDALFIPLGIHFEYLFGKRGLPSERLLAGIIPRDSDPFIISPSFERSNVHRGTGFDDIAVWEETESPYKVVAKEFTDRGIKGSVGVDPKLWILEIERLRAASSLIFKSSHTLLDELRSIKSEWEITQLQAAAKASTEGILAAIPELKQGISEKEFLKIVQHEMRQRSGSEEAFGLIQFGSNSALPHGIPSDRKLQNDQVALLDCGTPVNGYQGDITITVPFGHPKDYKEIYEIVFEANRMAFDAEKAGVKPSELDSIARNHIESKGYGPYFTHRLGHGIGMEVHETPYIVGSNQIPLVAGNCNSIEPGIYIPDKFGVRIEDDVWCKTNSAERLFDTPRHNFD